MPKLSIDIGVNLQDSTNQLGKLNSALISVNNNEWINITYDSQYQNIHVLDGDEAYTNSNSNLLWQLNDTGTMYIYDSLFKNGSLIRFS